MADWWNPFTWGQPAQPDPEPVYEEQPEQDANPDAWWNPFTWGHQAQPDPEPAYEEQTQDANPDSWWNPWSWGYQEQAQQPYDFDQIDPAVGGVIASGAGNVIASGAGNLTPEQLDQIHQQVIANGAGNLAPEQVQGVVQHVIANGAGNWTPEQIGQVIANGAGNMTLGDLQQVIASGAGNWTPAEVSQVIANGAGNMTWDDLQKVIANGAGNMRLSEVQEVIATGGGNLIHPVPSGEPFPRLVDDDAAGIIHERGPSWLSFREDGVWRPYVATTVAPQDPIQDPWDFASGATAPPVMPNVTPPGTLPEETAAVGDQGDLTPEQVAELLGISQDGAAREPSPTEVGGQDNSMLEEAAWLADPGADTQDTEVPSEPVDQTGEETPTAQNATPETLPEESGAQPTGHDDAGMDELTSLLSQLGAHAGGEEGAQPDASEAGQDQDLDAIIAQLHQIIGSMEAQDSPADAIPADATDAEVPPDLAPESAPAEAMTLEDAVRILSEVENARQSGYENPQLDALISQLAGTVETVQPELLEDPEFGPLVTQLRTRTEQGAPEADAYPPTAEPDLAPESEPEPADGIGLMPWVKSRLGDDPELIAQIEQDSGLIRQLNDDPDLASQYVGQDSPDVEVAPEAAPDPASPESEPLSEIEPTAEPAVPDDLAAEPEPAADNLTLDPLAEFPEEDPLTGPAEPPAEPPVEAPAAETVPASEEPVEDPYAPDPLAEFPEEDLLAAPVEPVAEEVPVSEELPPDPYAVEPAPVEPPPEEAPVDPYAAEPASDVYTEEVVDPLEETDGSY